MPVHDEIIAGHLDNLGFIPAIQFLSEAAKNIPKGKGDTPIRVLDVTRGVGLGEPLSTILRLLYEAHPTATFQFHRRPHSLPLKSPLLATLGARVRPWVSTSEGGVFHPFVPAGTRPFADMAVSLMHLQFLSKQNPDDPLSNVTSPGTSAPPSIPPSPLISPMGSRSNTPSTSHPTLIWGAEQPGRGGAERAKKDFAAFLRARAHELRSGGQLVVSLVLRDPSSLRTGNSLLDEYMSTIEYLLGEGEIDAIEASRLLLPVHLRDDDEVNTALAGAKGDFYVAEYSEHRACMTAWPLFDDGRLSSQVYGQTCAALVRALVNRWGRHRLGEERWGVVERKLENALTTRIVAAPTPGWVRFGYIRLEKL